MISQHQLFGTIVKISFYRVPKACFPSCIVGDFSWYYYYYYYAKIYYRSLKFAM